MSEDKQWFVDALSKPDSIMTSDVQANIKGYLAHGGDPHSLIQMLSNNYEGYAQMANLLQGWLEIAENSLDAPERPVSVTGRVQNVMKDVVRKNFNPERAALIFEDESGTPDWLAELIMHVEWRKLVYELSEKHPNSLMLNYLIKLIHDAGYQAEIAQISIIANHLDVFSGVLTSYVVNCLNQNEKGFKGNIEKVTSIACSSQHTYLYCQVLLHVMMDGPQKHLLQRLAEEVHSACDSLGEAARTEFSFYIGSNVNHIKVANAISAMVGTGKITHHLRDVYEIYRSAAGQPDSAPPIELIRFPKFLEMLTLDLFEPVQKLRAEVVEQCTYLVAYAVSMDGGDPSPSSDFQQTLHGLREVLSALQGVEPGTLTQTKTTTSVLYEYLFYPVIARGLLHLIKKTVCVSDFLNDTFTTKNLPPQFALLDEIATRHVLLRDELLEVLGAIFECPYSIDSMIAIDLKRKILDRFLYLFAVGHALQVLAWINTMCGKADLSLMVYILGKIIESIAPPFSSAFLNSIFPLLQRSDIQAGFANKNNERLAVVNFLRDALNTSGDIVTEDQSSSIAKCIESYSKTNDD